MDYRPKEYKVEMTLLAHFNDLKQRRFFLQTENINTREFKYRSNSSPRETKHKKKGSSLRL